MTIASAWISGKDRVSGSQFTLCPDFAYIRSEISIVAIARELGLYVQGTKARCWRTENHRNGDENPSLSFWVKKNRGTCFVCDQHSWSTIDLVMLHEGCDLISAALWIAERFPVRARPAGSHVRQRESWSPRFRSGVNDNVVTLLVKSGIWADLTPAEQSILIVLLTFTDSITGYAETSYRGLMRFSGVGSSATVSSAIKRFERMRMLSVARKPGELLFRGVNQYRLTLDDPDFQSLISKTFQRQGEEIEIEKQLREESRRALGRKGS